ncbi:hypothetical protein NCU06551 [Neurospora crassa OR74A]|uniref:FAR1 domain-containing protein n=1 Tax=Neurospora crassa (strain ATCC 24698 / 74-OR23-1A / CBS 708.71 / DSM 1257 / FGSC 987) TaxID=367110 RepID=V5IPX1_NEUCR|nr:hypothetical protein NCU06551 [Neurospora crassa OR74A]ESA42816.1 hypothetical protein NCU06551 [Neurospora crassa OR74A]|eukprot:XP_011394197.1 hypothetical protein NCU06551 [Neurospora crassa OR74A]
MHLVTYEPRRVHGPKTHVCLCDHPEHRFVFVKLAYPSHTMPRGQPKTAAMGQHGQHQLQMTPQPAQPQMQQQMQQQQQQLHQFHNFQPQNPPPQGQAASSAIHQHQQAGYTQQQLQPIPNQSATGTQQGQQQQPQSLQQQQQLHDQQAQQGQPGPSSGQGQGQPQPARPNFQMALLPPPQDRLYPTFEALQTDLKAFTRSQGYACVIVSSLNRDPDGHYRRYNLCCSKGGKTYTSHSRGIRQSRSTKTGCPMKMKAVQEKAWPYDDKWRVVVQCAEHNHEPFTGEQPGVNVPAQFRKIEQDGARWLKIMHRDAQCTLRQLTIGIRISFGDKYQYVKKSDVRNMLAKIKREDERKAAADAAAQGLPTNLPYTLIPPEHQPPPLQPTNVEMMPPLPSDLQVSDPDLESDNDDAEP